MKKCIGTSPTCIRLHVKLLNLIILSIKYVIIGKNDHENVYVRIL